MNGKVLAIGLLIFLAGVFIGTAQTYLVFNYKSLLQPKPTKIISPVPVPTPIASPSATPTPEVIYRYIYITRPTVAPTP